MLTRRDFFQGSLGAVAVGASRSVFPGSFGLADAAAQASSRQKDDLVFATARELAFWIRQRKVSSVEVVEAHSAQIARRNAALNAIVTPDEQRARARAKEADASLARGQVWGPLHGVPITIKDSLETAGLRTTLGFPPLANYVPAADAPVVARLRAAGAILIGKTNLPELALD